MRQKELTDCQSQDKSELPEPQTEHLRQSRRSVFLSKVCQMDKVSSIKSCGGCLLGVGETKRICRETGRFAAHPLILFVVIGFPCTLSNHLPK